MSSPQTIDSDFLKHMGLASRFADYTPPATWPGVTPLDSDLTMTLKHVTDALIAVGDYLPQGYLQRNFQQRMHPIISPQSRKRCSIGHVLVNVTDLVFFQVTSEFTTARPSQHDRHFYLPDPYGMYASLHYRMQPGDEDTYIDACRLALGFAPPVGSMIAYNIQTVNGHVVAEIWIYGVPSNNLIMYVDLPTLALIPAARLVPSLCDEDCVESESDAETVILGDVVRVRDSSSELDIESSDDVDEAESEPGSGSETASDGDVAPASDIDSDSSCDSDIKPPARRVFNQTQDVDDDWQSTPPNPKKCRSSS